MTKGLLASYIDQYRLFQNKIHPAAVYKIWYDDKKGMWRFITLFAVSILYD